MGDLPKMGIGMFFDCIFRVELLCSVGYATRGAYTAMAGLERVNERERERASHRDFTQITENQKKIVSCSQSAKHVHITP